MDLSSPPALPAFNRPEPTTPALLLRPLAAALARARLGEAAAAFAAELCELLHCARASVGVLEEGALRLAGSSHPTELESGQPAATGLLDAMQEALDQHRIIAWPAADGQDCITLAQRQLAASGAACSVPLVDGTRADSPGRLSQPRP